MRIRINGSSFFMMMLDVTTGKEYDVLATLDNGEHQGVVVRLENGQKYAISDNLYDVIEEGGVARHITDDDEISDFMAD